jgi:hypothetical protein
MGWGGGFMLRYLKTTASWIGVLLVAGGVIIVLVVVPGWFWCAVAALLLIIVGILILHPRFRK